MKIFNKNSRRAEPPLAFKILILLSFIYVIDFSLGKVMKHYYFKMDSGVSYRTTYSFDSTKSEMVIMGSSYASHHLIPEIFEDSFHMSVYNAGRDGNYMFYYYSTLKALMKRYTPKRIVLDFNFAAFEKDEISYESMSSLLPYYEDIPEIRPIILLKSQFEKIKLISKIYPYNSLLPTIVSTNLGLNKLDNDRNENKGFLPMFEVGTKILSLDTLPKEYPLDTNKINYFKRFIEDCQQADIKLYVLISPRLTKYKYEDPSITLASSIANAYNVPFLNFLNDTAIINHPQLFVDGHHLNQSGAEVYTKEVINTILKMDRNTPDS